MTRLPENVTELPLEVRAEMAFKSAVEEVLIESARQGLPMYIWRDGQVIALPQKELEAEAARLLAE
jgi:hypothetical protein